MPWGAPDRLPGAGMILYPTPGSTTVLAGAVFLASQFPEWALPPRIVSGSIAPPPQPPHPAPQAYAYNPGAYGAYTQQEQQNPYGPPSTQHYNTAQQQQYEQYILAPSSASTTNSDRSWPADVPYGGQT